MIFLVSLSGEVLSKASGALTQTLLLLSFSTSTRASGYYKLLQDTAFANFQASMLLMPAAVAEAVVMIRM